MNETTLQKILSQFTAACARREYCSWDILQKMHRQAVDEQTQAAVMAYLIEHRYIDDARYARAFVNDKARYNKWGRRKIEQALRLKHIESSVYAPFLNKLDEEEYQETLADLLAAKHRQLKEEDPYKRRTKLLRFALGRGFTMDEALDALESLA